MENNNSHAASVPNYVMIAVFLLIVIALFVFGDTFTAVLGLLIESLIFALNYKSDDKH